MESYIGQIQSFAFTYAPLGWAECNGQALPIQQNTALYALLGSTYGGDGKTYFNLPDLRARALVHAGTSPTLVEPQQLGEITTYGDGSDGTTQTLAIKYCICLSGYFPPRS